jgi:hypothetical protein
MRVTYDETATCWHILTVTEGGTVSILKNLNAPTARQAFQRLTPWREHPVEYINVPQDEARVTYGRGYSYTVGKSDLRTIEVLGPEGCDLDPWRGYKRRVVDVGAEREARIPSSAVRL